MVEIPQYVGFVALKHMVKRIILVAIGTILVLIFALNSCQVVKPGYRGIKVTLGSVSNTVLNEGIHFKAPFIQQIESMSVKIEKKETPADAVSKDLQDIKTTIAINYHIVPSKVNVVYKEYAKTPKEAEDIIIGPKVQEIVKAVVSKYNTLELISQREPVRAKIQAELTKVVLKYHIILDELSIVNFTFSTGFTQSIERKQIAEQDAITAQKKLEQIKFEAEQLVAAARGEAESNRLKQITLTPMLIEWEKTKKWNGVLPQVTGSGGTFVNLGLGK
ncbi:MAG: prohibitin family protein [Candidatus Cloacimonetes bacterium]|nr:prohibitin family protein [Candidatus Cloacimonadota bacterium]